jgi:hypothetical protein
MIPPEIADLATLIFAGWPELDEDDKEDREALRSIFASARRIHDAGYRKPPAEER